MRPIVGLRLGGATARGREPAAWLGEPTWSPGALLRDLELRLGYPQGEAAFVARIPLWAEWLAAHVDRCATPPFYARSFGVDRLGTTRTVLALRDALVDAGWDGQPIPGGGPRLATLAAVEESVTGAARGFADRVAAVERLLRSSPPERLYRSLRFVEAPALWSRRWQAVFAQLAARGTALELLDPPRATSRPETDLGHLQRLLRGEPAAPRALRGDGSLLALRGDTGAELAELTAALLAQESEGAVVVRPADPAPLEAALLRHGLPALGHATTSVWRPALQVLPLALELAYEPRDPFRVLELLTLPIGPFQGRFGALLARAVATQPGVGGAEWTRRKTEARAFLLAQKRAELVRSGLAADEAETGAEAHAAERLAMLADWIETPGAPARGAPRERLLAVVERVHAFLRKRLAIEELRSTYAAARDEASAMGEALARDPRPVLSRTSMRQLLDGLARGGDPVVVTREAPGRIDHVEHPAALLVPADTLVLWSFVSDEARPAVSPWTAPERAALAAAGVELPDPAASLRAEAEAWRGALLAARRRVVLVMPRTRRGEPAAPHPTWDEIAARLGLADDRAAAAITRTPEGLLAGRHPPLVPVAPLAPLRLPEPRAGWVLPPGRLGVDGERTASPTALEKLATCPLRFVLEHHARVRPGALAKVAAGPLLGGNLGHRLVEELHRSAVFEEVDEARFEQRVTVTLEALVAREGATLLLEGAAFERAQLVPQLVFAMRSLRRWLAESGWKIASVEEPVTATSAIGPIRGRLDVRLVNAEEKQAVLDLKWGGSAYRALLRDGRAVQLAAYVHALQETDGRSLPPAAYFVLGTGDLLTADPRLSATPIDGASLAETWQRVERTVARVKALLARGSIPVAATRRSLPLLEVLGVPEDERDAYHALSDVAGACSYCEFPAICGRAWEGAR